MADPKTAPASEAAATPPTAPVVTISATYGAGGSIVAPRLAERLGMKFFDRLIHNADSVTAGSIVERLTAGSSSSGLESAFIR